MNISIIGSGYVGLVTGASLANFGNKVTCVDINEDKIAQLKSGEIGIYEPNLKELISDNIKAGNISFTSNIALATKNSDVIFIAVGTPLGPDGQLDLKNVNNVVDEIAKSINSYKLIVTKSTVPVGTGKFISDRLSTKIMSEGINFDVSSNPEFLREGTGIYDFNNPDRIVVGSSSDRAINIFKEIYKPITQNGIEMIITSREAAELIKYAANAFLVTKISFINEVANLCEKLGIDVTDVAKGIGSDSRIGKEFLNPGPGYGGSCFPKDANAILKTAKDHGVLLGIIDSAVKANNQRKVDIEKRILEIFSKNLEDIKLGILGITFKANTDDIRESVAIEIIPKLQEKGALVRVYDPKQNEKIKASIANVSWFEDIYELSNGCDALIILTEWSEFKNIDFDLLRKNMQRKILIDFRNIFSLDYIQSNGFSYYSVGRPNVIQKD